ncbi:galactose oxidase early set domain-containing protein [Actinoplanes oblitus]|uniref:Galactose oxidase early set domain-containing protein n=1 Tax=Actinoplanes oblitus TaxID=3040509 RepID=A0ABY8W5D8_9ACTN|nr:galactose oxidase early set domain-containing protein [Actinoplanes oblitus]WIM93064.1 galactose oxidase early set domain-containing protein [Actinoplanes oblitus]
MFSAVGRWRHEQLINSMPYKKSHGFWQTVELPKGVRVNAIHAALLPSGRILLIAGSGNKLEQFQAGTFKTLVFDPASGAAHLVPTPTDLFCSGHTFLPDGKLLVAGGTLRYEVLKPDVKRAGGTMTVKNESPDGPRSFPKGTVFVAANGLRYVAGDAFTVPAATKTVRPARAGKPGKVTVTASATTVWVDAAEDGRQYAIAERGQYRIDGLTGDDVHNLYGLSEHMTMDKQDYQGRKETYEFDPVTESYQRVADMHEKRWYPTLTGLPDGSVLAVSGLDGSGQVVDGSQNEIFDPATKKWTVRKDLDRYFPTYPTLVQTARPGVLFYTGSNSGYGPADRGRQPGLWNLTDNSFRPVPGIREPDQLETSMSAWAGPVQKQTMMVVGGGGVGESRKSTRRIDIVDLSAPAPRFRPGPDLPQGTRYPNLVGLPDDTTLITNGARDYRGRGASDNHIARIYHPDTNTLSVAAAPAVGRNYHSSALLLPDGRVLTVGSDPLYADRKNTISGSFEQRIEVYTPPYLFHGDRPAVTGGPATVGYGGKATFSTSAPSEIRSVRLIRPGAATHMLNVDQRSVSVNFTRAADGITVTVPAQRTLLPPGPYMLFAINRAGVPSVARWVMVA